MYRVIARLIILPLLYVKNLLVAIGDYAAYIGSQLTLVLILSMPILLIVMGGYAAYLGYYLFALVPLSIGIFIAIGMAYLGIGMASAFAESSKPITDVSRYQEVRCRLSRKNFSHLPSEIPSDASNIQMYCLYGFQSFIFRLQMQLPRERIEEIQLQFRLTAKFKYIPGSENNSISVESKSDGMPSLDSYIDTLLYGREIGDRPSLWNYEILVLDADPSSCSHPLSYGVAIYSLTSEVIYWIYWG